MSRMETANPPEVVAKLWPKVAASGAEDCWIWTGATTDNGYGKYRGVRVHRLFFEATNGPIPADRIVRHSCDNRLCVNPRHLLLGTKADNSRDMVDRGRSLRGQRHPRARLTLGDVRYIRENPEGLKGQDIAARLGVSDATVSYVRSGRLWGQVPT